jgi:hypothetical protein
MPLAAEIPAPVRTAIRVSDVILFRTDDSFPLVVSFNAMSIPFRRHPATGRQV